MMGYSAALLRAQAEQQARVMDTEGSSDPNRVDYHSTAWLAQVRDVQLMRDLYAGTQAVREGGETYLPRFPEELDADYGVRLRKATLFNAVRRTVDAQTGMIFRKEPVLQEDVPAAIVSMAENIDLQGRALAVFAKDVFSAARIDGHSFILVDAPAATSPRQVSGSLAEVRGSGRRPFWRHVLKKDLINWRVEYDANGQPFLTLAVIAEWLEDSQGGYGIQRRRAYRELRPGYGALWVENDDGGLVKQREWLPTIDVVPLVPVYCNRTGYFASEPDLIDLAMQNVAHYQVSSDRRYAMQYACVPIPYATGEAEDNIVWGPNRFLFFPNEATKVGMLESSGNALPETREELRMLEENMASMGVATLVKQGRTQRTATEAGAEKEESDASLIAMARGLRDSLEEALGLTALYIGEADGGSVEVNKDFDSLMLSPQMALALIKMYEGQILTRPTVWDALVRGELLPETFDPERETADLEAQEMVEVERFVAARANAPG